MAVTMLATPGSASGGRPVADTTTTLPNVPTPTVNPPAPVPAPPALIPNLAAVRTELVQVGTLEMPTGMAVRAGDSRLYFTEKGGRVRTLEGRLVLDLSPEVSDGDERGLLGLTFSPDGSHMYVDFTDLAGAIRVVEFTWRHGGPDLKTRREVLSIPHPDPVHNGGNLAFGPDRFLYISVGDGGGYGDPANNAQNLGVLLGKILRIDPRPSAGKSYSIPATNPFVRQRGARPEIWAWGLRNPWRFSFDSAAGNLWIGDVGQDHWEEIDFQLGASPGGQNYGWARMEGNHPFYGSKPAGAVAPIYEYPHVAGTCAVTGGYVYRGNRISGLGGAYLFGDFCLGNVTAILEAAGRMLSVKPLGLNASGLTSFGQDANGELYVLTLSGPIYRIDPA
jgi:glucose/arabinose dehydrogenase